MVIRHCGNCKNMRVKVPVRKGRIIYTEAVAKCHKLDNEFKIGGSYYRKKGVYTEWLVEGINCPAFISMVDEEEVCA